MNLLHHNSTSYYDGEIFLPGAEEGWLNDLAKMLGVPRWAVAIIIGILYTTVLLIVIFCIFCARWIYEKHYQNPYGNEDSIFVGRDSNNGDGMKTSLVPNESEDEPPNYDQLTFWWTPGHDGAGESGASGTSTPPPPFSAVVASQSV